MSRFRLRVGFCLAVVAISLVALGVQHFAPVAAAAEPQVNAQALARAMQVQDRHTGRLMGIPGVVGTATGLDAAGQPVVKVFLERAGVPGIAAKVEGVPVEVEVTGKFFALPKPPAPPARRPGRNTAPTVTIVSPADGSTFGSGASITFQGTATDKEDGDLTASLVWTSNIAGQIGRAGTFSTTLIDGSHTISASVADSGGKTGSASITITVGTPTDPRARFPRPVPIGVSTGHPAITAGTIACRVVDADGNVFALSNNHVYANENHATFGDGVLQPGPIDGGGKTPGRDDVIGWLYDWQTIDFNGGKNTIDAAIALSLRDELGKATLLGNATPSNGYGTPRSETAAAFVGQTVMKYGRTTRQTIGQVYAINATVKVGYDTGVARFVKQIIVTPGTFSAGGDSGSLVVTADGNNPVGLLFAGSSSMTVCNPIDAVLSRFGVTIDGQ